MAYYTRFLSLLWIGLSFCLFTVLPVHAEAIPAKALRVVVKLTSIKAEKTTEQGGDELYFNVTQYSSFGRSRTERIPQASGYWSFKYLDKVKDISLWEGLLHDKEEIKLILSVVEQDFPPWDLDELIGGAQLLLKNKEGKLAYEWVVPVFEEQADIEMKTPGLLQEFVFKGAGAVYEVAFTVQEK